MATFSRSAVLGWNGDVMDGAGVVTAGTRAFDLGTKRLHPHSMRRDGRGDHVRHIDPHPVRVGELFH
jgi:hypothetical protein